MFGVPNPTFEVNNLLPGQKEGEKNPFIRHVFMLLVKHQIKEEEWRLAPLSASHYILKEAILKSFNSCFPFFSSKKKKPALSHKSCLTVRKHEIRTSDAKRWSGNRKKQNTPERSLLAVNQGRINDLISLLNPALSDTWIGQTHWNTNIHEGLYSVNHSNSELLEERKKNDRKHSDSNTISINNKKKSPI